MQESEEGLSYQLYLNKSPELSKMTGVQRLGIMENMNFLFIAMCSEYTRYGL